MIAAGVALVVALALPAAEVWRDGENDGENAPAMSVEANGFYKPFVGALVLPRELVNASQALLDAAPAGTLPPNARPLPDAALLTTHTVRAAVTAHAFDALEVAVAYQLAFVGVSDARFAQGSGVVAVSRAAPPRRFVDLDIDPLLYEDDDAGAYLLHHNLDRLFVKWRTPYVDVTVGRQAISWGTGLLWNPTDLFSPFSPTDVDREVRRGADAVRVAVPLGDVSEIDLIWLPQQTLDDNGGVVRARTNALDIDVSASVAKYLDDLVVGGDIAGDAGPFGWHAEAAWTRPLHDGSDDGTDDDFVRAVFGVACRPRDEWTVAVEYAFNGFGAEDPADILTVLQSERVARGEVFGAGRHYVGVVSSIAPSEVFSFSTAVIANVSDPSLLLVPSIEWSVDQSVLLRAGANLPLGAGVTTTLQPRSEYGLSPLLAFVQLGLYVN
jgi:hypothetical protein